MTMEYNKEFAKRLRLIPLEEARYFYSYHKDDDPPGARIENIIDLLIRRERKTFSEAIEKATLDYKNPPKSFDEVHRRVSILHELNAICAEYYRVSVKKQGSGIAKWNDKEFFTKHEIIQNNRLWLSKNIDGYNIYITPQETDDAIYILVDDADIARLKNDGFKPNLIIQSSQQSFQAIFVINRKYADREIYISIFNMLNKQYGDEGINGLRHPFRLCGYKNMKPGRQTFEVKIVETSTGECSKITSMADDIARQGTSRNIPSADAEKFTRCPVERKLVNRVLGYQKWVHGKFQGERFDNSRADIMLARWLREEIGATDDEIFTILLDMPMHINPDPVRYATRTTAHSRPAPVPKGKQQEPQDVSPGM